MALSSSKCFLKELGKKLWTVNWVRHSLDPALYKHAVLRMNLPSNIAERWDAKLEGDPRWKYHILRKDNANIAWIQHMLHHLAPEDSTALILADGSRGSISGGEGETHQSIIKAVLVEPIP